MVMALKKVNCNFCGEDTYTILFTHATSRTKMVKCKKCGLIYLNPCLSDKDLTEFYEKSFAEWTKRCGLEDANRNKATINYILKLIGESKARGKILDLGCATGNFLSAAGDMGWDTYGVDISTTAIHIAQNRGLTNMFASKIEDINFPDDFFDVVVALHTLEHVSNLVKTIREIRRILKKGGMVVIKVPNSGCYEKFPMKILEKLKNIMKRFLGVNDKTPYGFRLEHLNYFSPAILKKVLKKFGFTNYKIKIPVFPQIYESYLMFKQKYFLLSSLSLIYALFGLFNCPYTIVAYGQKETL